ncbi:hypothetical protein AWN90_33455 [Nocardia terpenica]|uniref:Uncharacterized protein n=1 Tax=Nocardia terpenica TaxID=455432 RepID=A0A164MNV7_9NOCA|nr:hypothetical protein AWN90_33455 [Nocardia terpenica]
MRMMSRVGAGVAAFGVVVGVACAAPDAVADVTAVEVAPGMSFGSSGVYGTGCSYTITATAKPGTSVLFIDEVGGVRTQETLRPPGAPTGDTGKAQTVWTPDRAGVHTIWAGEYPTPGAAIVTSEVNVGTGINLGPACLVLP